MHALTSEHEVHLQFFWGVRGLRGAMILHGLFLSLKEKPIFCRNDPLESSEVPLTPAPSPLFKSWVGIDLSGTPQKCQIQLPTWPWENIVGQNLPLWNNSLGSCFSCQIWPNSSLTSCCPILLRICRSQTGREDQRERKVQTTWGRNER